MARAVLEELCGAPGLGVRRGRRPRRRRLALPAACCYNGPVSLSLKYLVPLNLLILLVWSWHFLSSRGDFERALLGAERTAIEQAAFGLKLRVEDVLARGAALETLAEDVAVLAGRWPGLDLMVVDDSFTVLVASSPDRVGTRWYEERIESVLAGADSAWNLEDHTHDGRQAVDVSLGVVGPGGEVRHVVHLAAWLDRLLVALHRQRQHDLRAALAELVAVAIAVNLLTYYLVLRPLSRIRRQIAATGWLEARPRLGGQDEIRHLGAVVEALLEQMRTRYDRLSSTLGERDSALEQVSADRDHLARRIKLVSGELAAAEARLVRAERIAAVSQLSSALAHELRNPLHIIRATAETAATACPEVADLAEDIKDEVDRVNRLITELLQYARPEDLRRHQVDVRELLEEVRQRMCRGLCGQQPDACALCTVAVEPAVTSVECDPVLLGQALMNLFANAREVSPAGGVIEVSASRGEDGQLELSVADRGPGIADEDRDRLFEPFFTRKRDGTGLGLPVVQKIADLHEGAVELEAREGGGVVARLRLPAPPRGAAP